MGTHYHRGSEWRRWDLHIHTPCAVRANDFEPKDWETYIDALEAAPPEISAIGITDYCSIDGYKRIKQYQDSGRVPNIPLILPNIEFRLSIPSKKGAGINAHLLFSPHDPDHIEKIASLLGDIRMELSSGDVYRCTRPDLIRLGKRTNPQSSNDDEAYATGNLQFKLDLARLRDIFRQPWVKRNCLVAFSNADYDGVSALANSPSFSAIRDDIYHLSHFIFSATPKDRAYFLGKSNADSPHDVIRRYGALKPCLHGSDAHDYDRLFNPVQNRFCWIKSDPTFDGLRQVLYEPEERVWIGENPPLYQDRARIIQSVRVDHASGWFQNTSIDFNNALVAIIGEKGSGKTALAELIAYACGSWKPDQKKTFLERAGHLISGTRITIDWLDGPSTVVTFDGIKGQGTPKDAKVRYLSQRFVEQLCAEDVTADALVHEIENVIFAHLDSTETLRASNFQDLRALRTKRYTEQRQQIAIDIQRSIDEIDDLRSNVLSLDSKKAELEKLAAEREGLTKQLPIPADDAATQLELKITQAHEALERIQEMVAAQRENLLRVENIESKKDTFLRSMQRFHAEITLSLKEAGFAESDLSAFKPIFSGDIEEIIKRRRIEIGERIENLTGADDEPATGTLLQMRSHLDALEKQRTADQSLRDKATKIQRRLAEIGQNEKRLRDELARIREHDIPRIGKIRTELVALFISYFMNYEEELKILSSLYKPVSERLKVGGDQEKSLSFYVRWHIDMDSWFTRAAGIFDARKKQPYGLFNEMEQYFRKNLLDKLETGQKDQIAEIMDAVIGKFVDINNDTSSFLRTSYGFRDLLEWLFNIDHVSLQYGLKYDDVPLENLSPGSKGIVLLILYLGIDNRDTRPIIIDQPEENLDNRSVYALLTKYFREAKKYRQIFIITHNPNLVVSTDAEQVIVANASRQEMNLPKISYMGGALEFSSDNPAGIREYVCDILEGGKDAFARREYIYGSQLEK